MGSKHILGDRTELAGNITTWLLRKTHKTLNYNIDTHPEGRGVGKATTSTAPPLRQPLLDGGQGEYSVSQSTAGATIRSPGLTPTPSHGTSRDGITPSNGITAARTAPSSHRSNTNAERQGRNNRPRSGYNSQSNTTCTRPPSREETPANSPPSRENTQVPRLREKTSIPVVPDNWAGLHPPRLASGEAVTGEQKRSLWRENKQRRIRTQLNKRNKRTGQCTKVHGRHRQV